MPEGVESNDHLLANLEVISNNLDRLSDSSRTNRAAFIFDNGQALDNLFELSQKAGNDVVQERATRLLEEVINKSAGPNTNYIHWFRNYQTEIHDLVLHSDNKDPNSVAKKYTAIADLLDKHYEVTV